MPIIVFRSCDPRRSSCQAETGHKHSSHLSVCGPPRYKQIIQQVNHTRCQYQTQSGRANYYWAHHPDFRNVTDAGGNALSIKASEEESHHYAWHFRGLPQSRRAMSRGHELQYAANLSMAGFWRRNLSFKSRSHKLRLTLRPWKW